MAKVSQGVFGAFFDDITVTSFFKLTLVRITEINDSVEDNISRQARLVFANYFDKVEHTKPVDNV